MVFIKLKYLRHLPHTLILLIMRLFEVVIPKMAFKCGANNFNFIRVRLGQVRLSTYLMLIVVLIAPQVSIIFAISSSNNPIINKIYA